MTFSIILLCLILLQSNLTEQATEETTEQTTENTTSHTTEETTDNSSSSYSANTETSPYTESTTENSSFGSTSTETDFSTESTADFMTDVSRHTQTVLTLQTTEIATEGTTSDPNTDSTVSTELTNNAAIIIPLLQPKLLPSDVSNRPENMESDEEELQSNKANSSTVNVVGIVLASIVGSIAVFYIIQLLIKKYRRKSYIVRSPGMELGRA